MSAATSSPRDLTSHRPVEGILWMVLSGISFVCVNGGVHHLGTALPSAESAFLRFLIGLVLLFPALVAALRVGVSRRIWPLVGLRGLLHTLAVLFWFYAMARIPVAEVTAIGYLSPIVVTVGAALFLGERLAFRRIAAICVALIGAVIVLRPGLRELQPGHFAQLAASVFFGLSYIVAKRLASVLPASALVALMSLTVTIGLLPVAMLDWVWPTTTQYLWLLLVALFATSGHYCMARAFATAPVSMMQPVVFLQLVWATALGWLAFGEAVDPWVILGGAVIIGAISYMSWREAQIARAGATPLADAEKT